MQSPLLPLPRLQGTQQIFEPIEGLPVGTGEKNGYYESQIQ